MNGFFASSAIQKSPRVGLLPKCGACGLYRTCHSPKMNPYGDFERKVLVVGEAPGETEDEKGRPFVGKAGRHLRDVLGKIGADLDSDALTTNALICRPPKNATPDAKQLGYCRPNLLQTLRTHKPAVVVVLGRSALESLLHGHWTGSLHALERWVGWQIPLEGFWLCPTYHPSYLLRMQNQLMDRQFRQHLRAAFALKKPPPSLDDYPSMVEVIFDDEKAVKALREFDAKGGWIAVDYETNCLKPEWPKGRIYCCAVSDGERTISYPWVGQSILATGDLLRSNRTKKISSNLKMEERWTLKVFGHGVTGWGWDTMLAAHCLDNRPHICSLKFQLFVRMGWPSYNTHVAPYLESHNGPYNRIQEVDFTALMTYNGLDALGEYKLAMVQRQDMGYDES